MHRKLLTVIILFSAGGFLLAQNIGREVISGSGGVLTESGLQLSWTIGQSGLAGTLSNTDLILTQGFEQENDDQFVAIININQQEVAVELFPNPVMSNASLKLTSELTTEYTWTLFDCNGFPVIKSENNSLIPGSIIEIIPSKDLNPGMYYLQIFIHSSGKTRIVQSIKLIKI